MIKTKKNILFIVLSENNEEIEFIKRLASLLKRKGAKISIFFMNRGVKTVSNFREFEGELSLCSRNADEFSVKEEENPHVKFASQYELSKMVEEADIIIPFT